MQVFIGLKTDRWGKDSVSFWGLVHPVHVWPKHFLEN